MPCSPYLYSISIRRHTGERPYACKQCDMRFQTRGNVKRHMRSHTGEKPFECDVCSARFTEKKSLVNHRCELSIIFRFRTSDD